MKGETATPGGAPTSGGSAGGLAGANTRRARMKPLVLLVALLPLLALTAIGLTYAQWSETLSLTATISTGSLDVDIVSYNTAKSSDYLKVQVTTNSNDGDSGADSMTISLQNAYPGAEANITFTLKNVGTIPAKANVVLDKNAIPASMQSCIYVTLYDANNATISSAAPILYVNDTAIYTLSIKIDPNCDSLPENTTLSLPNIVTISVEQYVQ